MVNRTQLRPKKNQDKKLQIIQERLLISENDYMGYK